MATTVMEAYYGTAGSGAWTALGSNHLGFFNTIGTAGSAITPDSIPTASYNGGTHVINAAHTTDICTNPHTPNIKYLTSSTWSLNGAASAAISEIADTSTSFRWHFNDASSRVIQNVNIHVYNNSSNAVRATGVDAQGWVKGNSMTTWTEVNNDSATSGGTGSGITGGGLARTTATDQYWYCALSMSPESAGAKVAAAGISLEYV